MGTTKEEMMLKKKLVTMQNLKAKQDWFKRVGGFEKGASITDPQPKDVEFGVENTDLSELLEKFSLVVHRENKPGYKKNGNKSRAMPSPKKLSKDEPKIE
jgi:hypothetical protein